MTADELIDDILTREGGYVNHPADRGGPTNFGITQATLSRWRGHTVSAASVQALTIEEARDILSTEYLEQPGFLHLPEPLRAQVVDFAVTSGQAQAVKNLQGLVGTERDGILGPVTRGAVSAHDPYTLAVRYWQERIRFYAQLAARPAKALRPSQQPFLNGWLNRCFAMQPHPEMKAEADDEQPDAS